MKKHQQSFKSLEGNFLLYFLVTTIISFFFPLVIQYIVTSLLHRNAVLEVGEEFLFTFLILHVLMLVAFFGWSIGTGVWRLRKLLTEQNKHKTVKNESIAQILISIVFVILTVCNPIYWMMYLHFPVVEIDNIAITDYLKNSVGKMPHVKYVYGLTFGDEKDFRHNLYDLRIEFDDGGFISMQNSSFSSLFDANEKSVLMVGQIGNYRFCTKNPNEENDQCWHMEITAPDIKKHFPFELKTLVDVVNHYKEIEAEVSTWPRDPNHTNPEFMTYKGSNFGYVMENISHVHPESSTRLFVKDISKKAVPTPIFIQ